ncbi:hypothetical protein [Glaciibacter psychrotolerans]|uniref:Uncharacterized protein n=1 Tax=Glaciibacter psychrotolerans TaxID=670054 RepID=A0A7Z0EE01_9MICO|nr:hypothetical protein [Leifsonia psychrotolerans]NYJ19157.1 hypothetical protein [Leifsonia psychrotolerans]
MSGFYARSKPTYTPALRDRVLITQRVHGREPGEPLDGWIVALNADMVTISATPDDDGRDDYDRNTFMRASFVRDRYTSIEPFERTT